MTKHGAVPVVGRSHVTATKFAFFAEERPTKKLQDPGLSVPGIGWMSFAQRILDFIESIKCYMNNENTSQKYHTWALHFLSAKNVDF